jgi:hypothetical protein
VVWVGIGWFGQRLGRFPRPVLSLALLAVYGCLVTAAGLVGGFLLFAA